MSKITCKCEYDRIKIYINNILHISLPNDSNTKIQSWKESDTIYKIEIRSANDTDEYGYDNFEIWKQILDLLDKNI